MRALALSLWERPLGEGRPLPLGEGSLALSGRRTATRTPKAFRAPRSGAENLAQGASPGAAGTPHESAAERRKKNVHSKTYRGSYANAMLLQKLEILLGERLPAMMLFLLRDVRAHALCA